MDGTFGASLTMSGRVVAFRTAENDGVDIRLYSIIYDAIEEVKDAMAGMLSPEVKEEAPRPCK